MSQFLHISYLPYKFALVDEFIIKQHPLKSNFIPEGVGFFTGAAPAGSVLFAPPVRMLPAELAAEPAAMGAASRRRPRSLGYRLSPAFRGGRGWTSESRLGRRDAGAGGWRRTEAPPAYRFWIR